MTQPFNSPQDGQGFIFSDKIYKTGKWVTMILLPALATTYFMLSEIWGLPEPMKVMGTITAISTLFGTLLGLSSKSYNKSDVKYDGSIDFTPIDGTKMIGVKLNSVPEKLEMFPELKLKVTTGKPIIPDDLPEEPT